MMPKLLVVFVQKLKEKNYKMKRKDEHTVIFLIGIIIAAGVALYRGADFDLFTIIGIFFGGLMIFGGIVTLLQRW